MKNLKIEKKVIKQKCWACNGRGCKVCEMTGKWNETTYLFIYEKNGKKYAIDSDNLS